MVVLLTMARIASRERISYFGQRPYHHHMQVPSYDFEYDASFSAYSTIVVGYTTLPLTAPIIFTAKIRRREGHYDQNVVLQVREIWIDCGSYGCVKMCGWAIKSLF